MFKNEYNQWSSFRQRVVVLIFELKVVNLLHISMTRCDGRFDSKHQFRTISSEEKPYIGMTRRIRCPNKAAFRCSRCGPDRLRNNETQEHTIIFVEWQNVASGLYISINFERSLLIRKATVFVASRTNVHYHGISWHKVMKTLRRIYLRHIESHICTPTVKKTQLVLGAFVAFANEDTFPSASATIQNDTCTQCSV